MISPRLFVAVLILLTALFALFALWNPGAVSLTLPWVGSWSVPLPALVLFVLVVGAVAVFLLFFLSDVEQNIAASWRRRKARDAVAEDPSNLPALVALAEDHERMGRVEEAITVLERIRAHDRGNLVAAEKLRDLLAERRRWKEAAGLQEEILKRRGITDPHDPEYQRWVGMIYTRGLPLLQSRRWREAAELFRSVVKKERTFVPAYLQLGEAYRVGGSAARAERIWARAFAITRHSVFLQVLERLYMEQEQPHRLIDFYHRAILRYEGDPLLQFALGKLYLRLEMLEEAEDQFRRLTEIAPSFAPAHVAVAQIAERRGDLRSALEHYRHAVDLAAVSLGEFRCTGCGAARAQWADRCDQCGRWNSLGDSLRTAVASSPPPVPSPFTI